MELKDKKAEGQHELTIIEQKDNRWLEGIRERSSRISQKKIIT